MCKYVTRLPHTLCQYFKKVLKSVLKFLHVNLHCSEVDTIDSEILVISETSVED